MGRNIKLICHGTKRGKEGLIKEKHVCYYQNKVQCIIANIANILTNVLIKSFSFLICLPLLKISKKTKTKTTNEQTKTKKTKTTQTDFETHTHTLSHNIFDMGKKYMDVTTQPFPHKEMRILCIMGSPTILSKREGLISKNTALLGVHIPVLTQISAV